MKTLGKFGEKGHECCAVWGSRAKDAERSDEDNERSKDSFSNKITDQSAPRKNSASNHTINPYLQAISGLFVIKTKFEPMTNIAGKNCI